MFDQKKLHDFTNKYLERVATKPVSSLIQKEIEQAYESLIEIIGYHNWLYYITSQTVIADVQYDALFAYIKEIETLQPDIIHPDSPTQKLTYQLQDEFFQAQHKIPLLSLENSYNAKDLADWNESLQKLYAKEQIDQYSFICQPKYDGVSIELVYEHGALTQAITRGDGYVGEDITQNIKTLFSIPMVLKATDITSLRVRGEVVMSKKALERLNEERRNNNESEFANVRNAASWSIRQLDTSITAKRGLTCYVYEILEISSINLQMANNDTEALTWLSQQWFMMHPWQKHVLHIDDVIAICESAATKNYFDNEDIEFDGVVVKVHELSLRSMLWSTNHHPRWAMAYKFPAKQIVTRINSVDYQVGRTWVITPAANLEPVELSGVTISRASLHNFDFITEKDIRIGDWVWLQRSWEVIPYVIAAITERRTGDEKPIVPPTVCPECGWVVEKAKSDIYIYCTNSACPAKIIWQILYFVSRDAANIDGVWDSLVELLIRQWLVSSIADLYSLEESQVRLQLVSQAWVGQKKYFELIEEIKKSKVAPLWRLLNWLGIMHIGKKTAQIIIDAVWEQLTDIAQQKFTIYDLESYLTNHDFLLSIKWIWPETITSLEQWFHNTDNKNILERMAQKWVARNMFDTKTIIKGKLTWVSFCISWTFGIPRKVLSDILSKHGAVVTENITQQTNFLVVGENPSSKVSKAQDYNIPIVEW
jgi:DNA ligase (NAD+)